MFSKTVCVDGRFLLFKVGVDNFGGRQWRGRRRQAVDRQSTVQSIDNNMEVAAREQARVRVPAYRRWRGGISRERGAASEVATLHWSTILDDVIGGQPRSPTRPSVASPHRRHSPVAVGATRNNCAPPPPPPARQLDRKPEPPCVFVNACRRRGALRRRLRMCLDSLFVYLLARRF